MLACFFIEWKLRFKKTATTIDAFLWLDTPLTSKKWDNSSHVITNSYSPLFANAQNNYFRICQVTIFCLYMPSNTWKDNKKNVHPLSSSSCHVRIHQSRVPPPSWASRSSAHSWCSHTHDSLHIIDGLGNSSNNWWAHQP
jgi:hypothetical protein